ncbi:MAG: division/cell wall cluster transcriptional repressor MraZ [Desulfovibrio sp.]|nr:division/cell wall cluster transcriptional repressor MraZ [Desulfovibrio sp.]
MTGKFIGTYNRALDAKGRVSLPPSFLKALENDGGPGSFWLTGLYGRLTGYAPERWEEIVEKLCSIKLPSLKLSNFKTKLVGMAQEISPDAQGRIRIPQSLIREAGLGKDAVLVGILDKFEIWDQARFDAISVEDVSEELIRFGIDLTL